MYKIGQQMAQEEKPLRHALVHVFAAVANTGQNQLEEGKDLFG